jgi:hypothetical protein
MTDKNVTVTKTGTRTYVVAVDGKVVATLSSYKAAATYAATFAGANLSGA